MFFQTLEKEAHYRETVSKASPQLNLTNGEINVVMKTNLVKLQNERSIFSF